MPLTTMNNMTSGPPQLLRNLYEAFNKREFEKIISMMQPDVKWANGMEGGFVYGRDAVREYWRKQFEVVQGQLRPLKFEMDENNRNVVTIHLVVRDLEGNVLVEKTVQQIFTIENGLISIFEIGGTEPLHLTETANKQ
jgi:nuclear transport factor 2 (NTF2) superfamily protein